MKYTAEERRSIDLTLNIFAPYLESSPYYDIVYSDNTGYMQITREKAYGDTYATPIESCAHLLQLLFDEVVDDVKDAQLYGSDESPTLCADEAEEVRRRVTVMLDKLLEHRTYCLIALHGYLKHYNDSF